MGERGREVGLRIEKSDLDFKERERGEINKICGSSFTSCYSTVIHRQYHSTIAKNFVIRRPGNACYLYFDAKIYHSLLFTSLDVNALRVKLGKKLC